MVELKHPFSESFFEEEDRLGFPIDRKRKEIWAVELDMLLELDRVCRKLGLRYFLDGGTLLGAARDGRFIPWDDDIDVSLLRDDYDRFVREAPDEFDFPLFLQTGYTEKDYIRGHCQLRNSLTAAIRPQDLGKAGFNQGIFLDIFVLDALFDDRVERQYEEYKRLKRLHRRAVDHGYRGDPLRWLGRQFSDALYRLKYSDSAAFYRELEAIFRSNDGSEYIDYMMLNHSPEEIHHLRRAWYEESVLLPFEVGLFPAPKGYREYLEAYYGKDWMIPANIVSMHNRNGQVIFDTSRSYAAIRKELGATVAEEE